MRALLLSLLLVPFVAIADTGPARGQTIQTPSGTYYNYYDQNGNPYFPGGTQQPQGTPYRSGTKIKYDNNNSNSSSGYYDTQSQQGPPGQGRPFREHGKIIYR